MFQNNECVLAFGSAVSENILQIEKEIEIGHKQFGKRFDSYGGSCVNYTSRLLYEGVPVLPVAPVGMDPSGERIFRFLKDSIEECFPNNIINQIYTKDFALLESYSTPQSTIVIHESTRTIISEKKTEGFEELNNFFISKVINFGGDNEIVIRGILIGHIYGEDKNNNSITNLIINTFSNINECVIGLNIGSSQISLGVLKMQENLKKIDFLQLTLSEMKLFFQKSNLENNILYMIKWLKNAGINTIITIDKFGAIIIDNRHNDILMVWPYELKNLMVDSTGAGDAFFSGFFFSYLIRNDIVESANISKLWAAFVCTKIGGAVIIPSVRAINQFKDRIKEFGVPIFYALNDFELIARVIEKAYSD